MIQRLFLDRVHAEAAGSPVCGQDNLILPAFAYEAEALLPLLELTKPRTEVALDTAVISLCQYLVGNPVGEFIMASTKWQRCMQPVNRYRTIR